MVSDFLTPFGRLHEVVNGERKYVHETLETGPDRYWTADKLVMQLHKAVALVKRAFPGKKVLWLFDNATLHQAMAPEALLASKMNLNPGGKQPRMRDGLLPNGSPQSMCFPEDHSDHPGQAKGARVVLQERGLWQRNMRLRCKKCRPDENCCATAVLAQQPDFVAQKCSLEELLTKEGFQTLFLPKFHCELNWIEQFWSSVKYHTRHHCEYNIAGLRKTLDEALLSVPDATIFRYFLRSLRIMQAYKDGLKIATKEFEQRVYQSHRRVEDKSRW
jgi:hypothetical protein